MRDPDGFEGYGTILELLEKDRFLVEMPNGHRVYGVIQKKNKNRIVRPENRR
jgi:translation initiation factor IF-1